MTDYPIYTPRELVGAFRRIKTTSLWLKTTFFPDERPSNKSVLMIDVYKEAYNLMADFVHPRLDAQPRERQGYERLAFEPAYIKEMVPIVYDDIEETPFGVDEYTDWSLQDELDSVIAQNLARLRRLWERRLEWMAAQVMNTGKCPIIGRGVDREVDFRMRDTHLPVLMGDEKWDDYDNADPITNIINWAERVFDDSGLAPTHCILGKTAWGHLKKNKQAATWLDNRRFKFGEFTPKKVSPALYYLGRIEECDLDLYRYSASYFDEDGEAEVPFVPDDRVVIATEKAYSRTHYGAIRHLKALMRTEYFVNQWETPNGSQQNLEIESAPLTAMHDSDAFLSATVH